MGKASRQRSEALKFAFAVISVVALFALTGTTAFPADTIRVAVASNFAPTLRALQPGFEDVSGFRLSLSAGATGKHYAQILQGAPFDVFLAADAERPALLEDQGLAITGSRFTYALGRLVLWAPHAASAESGDPALIELLRTTPPQRLAIANPRLAPYGTAAEAYLRNQGLWAGLEPHLVMGENVGQAFQFVATGAVPMGLVALSQLRTLNRQQNDILADHHVIIDSGQYPPIAQQAVLLEDTPGARAFLEWLGSEAVRAKLIEFGYDTPHAER